MSKAFDEIGRPGGKNNTFASLFSRAMDQQIQVVDQYTLEKYKNGHQFIKLYPSSMPSCSCSLLVAAVKWVVGYNQFVTNGTLPLTTSNAWGETYGTMGSIRHTISQRYTGLTGRIIGNWSCPCGGKRSFTTHLPCPKCGSLMTYEEINVQLWSQKPKSSGMTGKYPVLSAKIDAVFVDDDEVLWIGDYKFKTSRGFDKQAREKLPQPVHALQVGIYTALFRNVFKKSRLRDVNGWILLYVAFDELGLHKDSRLWMEKRQKVKRSSSDKIWNWLHGTEIPKADNANSFAHSIVKSFLLKPTSKRAKAKLLDEAVRTTICLHDCEKNGCAFGTRQSTIEEKLRQSLLELLD